jgi:DNA polymerase
VKHLFIDFETSSDADIKKVGSYAYLRDPSTRVNCVAWAIDKGNVNLWVAPHLRQNEYPCHPFPPVRDANLVIAAHNVEFELEVLRRFYKLDIPLDRVYDSVPVARAWGIPADLHGLTRWIATYGARYPNDYGAVVRALGGKQKDAAVTACFGTTVPAVDPRWPVLFDYCKHDVKLERAVHQWLLSDRDLCHPRTGMHLTPTEHEVWTDTIALNQRGVPIDLDAARKCEQAVADFTTRKIDECVVLCGIRPSQPKLKHFLGTPDLKAATIKEALESGTLSEVQTKVAEIRVLVAGAAVKKLPTLIAQTDPKTNRLHGALVYHGAHTGRWTSKGAQLHNIKRSTKSTEEAEAVLEAIRNGSFLEDDENPMATIGGVLRSLIVPPPGQTLFVADYRQIEARVVCHLANEKTIMGAFTRGEDPYMAMAKTIDPKNPDRRMGKEVVLGAGFGMGVDKFLARLKVQGFNLTREQARDILVTYRLHDDKAVPNCWTAISCKLEADYVQQRKHGVEVTFNRLTALGVRGKNKGSHRCYMLPSGRLIHYHDVEFKLDPESRKLTPEKLHQMNEDILYMMQREGASSEGIARMRAEHASDAKGLGLSKRTLTCKPPHWEKKQFLHRGLLTENVVQAIARDIMVEGMRAAKKAGYQILLTVHDEVVAVKEGGSTVEFKAALETKLRWPGWESFPVEVEAEEVTRYS